MGLLQVSTNTVTSAVSDVTLTGIDDDSVYMLVVNNFVPSTDAQDMKLQVVQSGSPNSSSLYHIAAKLYRTDTSYNNDASSGAQTEYDCSTAIGNDTGECANWIFHIYNANATEFTMFQQETVQLGHTALLVGRQGGGAFKGTGAVEGIKMFAGSGNIQSGTFTLYKVV
tara:strand:- start:246 stop:752 length:507 start_codon:yes stop_codon:yes gene_type:complete